MRVHVESMVVLVRVCTNLLAAPVLAVSNVVSEPIRVCTGVSVVIALEVSNTVSSVPVRVCTCLPKLLFLPVLVVWKVELDLVLVRVCTLIYFGVSLFTHSLPCSSGVILPSLNLPFSSH